MIPESGSVVVPKNECVYAHLQTVREVYLPEPIAVSLSKYKEHISTLDEGGFGLQKEAHIRHKDWPM